uniref:ILR3 n=1 Tax=Arundo donax TaxID=35708 RepID=A0A0A9H4G6_ARUDO
MLNTRVNASPIDDAMTSLITRPAASARGPWTCRGTSVVSTARTPAAAAGSWCRGQTCRPEQTPPGGTMRRPGVGRTAPEQLLR